MNLRFWQKESPPPRWAKELSEEEKHTLAANLRAMLEPKRAMTALIESGIIERSLPMGSRSLPIGSQGAPLR